jgi:hypothetical protein
MGRLEGPVEIAVRAVERNPELLDEQLSHQIGSFARELVDGRGVAQAAPRPLDVAGERFGRVPFRAADDPPLRPERVRRFRLVGPGHDDDAGAPAGRGERRRAAGDPGADDEDVDDVVAHAIDSSRAMSVASTEWVNAPTDTKSTPVSA